MFADFSTKHSEWLQQVKGTTKKSDLDALVSSLREELGQLRVAKVRCLLLCIFMQLKKPPSFLWFLFPPA